MTQSFPDIELKALDGETLKLPAQTKGKLTLLLFVEPPAENEEDFPVELDRNGKPSRNDPFRNVMGFAKEMAGRHIHGEVEVITAFLSENAEQARSLMEKNEWQFKTVLVPGGLYNPMVRQLGILSADKIPNVFLLRRDSTIAWHTSGFIYKSDFGYPFAVRLAMKVHIEKCDTELAYKALARKDYQEAHRIFSGPFLPEKDERYLWRAPRFHGRALANVGLGKWEDALADIDVAIEYQRTAFKRPVEKPSISILNMLQLRATILEKLGRKDEALESQKAAQVEPVPYRDNIYDSFHRKLADLSFD